MKLKYLSTPLPPQERMMPVRAMTASPNMNKLAAVVEDRTIVLFDDKGAQRDRFSTKPIDGKYSKRSYIVLSLAFSPDSASLAVGQSDNVVFVYKIGADWNEKKVITNKLVQTGAVTALAWPFDDKVLIGLIDGKMRVGLLKQNKCASLYKTEMGVIGLATSSKRTSFVSSHMDGSIILYNFASKTQEKLCTHSCAAYSIAFTAHAIVAGGADRRIMCYSENGIVQQTFDFSSVDEREFSSLIADPTGQNFVAGSFDRLRLFSWNAKRGNFEEGNPLEIENLYTISSLAWKADGSTVYAGTLCGGIFAIDCCVKRKMLRSRFETTYVSPSHVLIRDVTTEQRTSLLSRKGLPIDEIKMMGEDRFVVGYTASTLIVAELDQGRFSEIEWTSGGNEKFYFDNANVCLIVNVGEITIVEYGTDGPVGWIRTELTSPHLISIRLAERGVRGLEPSKKIAYLLDPSTISIMDLSTGAQEHTISHGNSIDWLELNETGRKLLFRDKRQRVHLVDLAGPDLKQANLLAFCTYCQWVPTSDVIVAQSGDSLHVWYNPDHPDQVTTVSIKGDVEAVLRDADRTEVIVQESSAKVAYELDNTQIEFATALENLDFERAVSFLEKARGDRCYAAIGDMARVNLLQQTIELAAEAAERIGGDGTADSRVRANIAKLCKRYKEAENIYLEQNNVEDAVKMYQTLHKWDDALELAKATNYTGYEQLKATYYRSLADTGQDGKAAELKVAEGNRAAAVQLYLKANQPAQALRLVLHDEDLLGDEQLAQSVAVSLLKNRQFDKAGSLFEKLHDFTRALESYKNGKAYSQAIQLARVQYPQRVVELEEEWGDALVKEGKHEAAISHYVEASQNVKAVEAAIRAKEFNRAVQIVDAIQDQTVARRFYEDIATYYAESGDYDRAERYFIEADAHQAAIQMYLRAGKWAEGYRLSAEFLGKEDTTRLYLQKAEDMENNGMLAEAEQLFLAIGDARRAIEMYRAAGRSDDVVRLTEKYDEDRVMDVHKELGASLEADGELRAAEEAYLKAGDYDAAITMYKTRGQFSDAHRLAVASGSQKNVERIGYEWAKSTGGGAAVTLLNKLGFLNQAIAIACESGDFDFAFDLARSGAKDKLPDVHRLYGAHHEDEGNFDEASRHYIDGGAPGEAVKMWIEDKDWHRAEEIATAHAPELLNLVYDEQAREAMEAGDFQRMESFLLRANKPLSILDFYTNRQMWPEAMRIAKEYAPGQIDSLQKNLDDAELRGGARGVDSFLVQGREWEANGEYLRAAAAYLKVNPQSTENTALIRQCAIKAADITIKFLLGPDRNQQLIEVLLASLEAADASEKAAEVHIALGEHREAIMALCRARQWGKAKAIAQELMPAMAAEVDAAYKESLKSEGNVGELIDVDVIAAIDLLIERGQWEKALDTAMKQKHKPLLEKYVAIYTGMLVNNGDIEKAVEIFLKYGICTNEEVFNTYIKIFDEIIQCPASSPLEEFHRLSLVRNLMLAVVQGLGDTETSSLIEFSRSLWAAHFMAFHVALGTAEFSPETQNLRLRQQLALLRYSDLIPADRLFYHAGIAARELDEYKNVGFVLLNHFLDLVEAIDEDNPAMVDSSIFEGTDIPLEIPLPREQSIGREEVEAVKDWVLAMSVDENAEKVLPEDRRQTFESSIVDRAGNVSRMCVISGYPVLDQRVELGNGLDANKEDLNRFLFCLKQAPNDQLHDVQSFLSSAAKKPITLSI
uniref:Osm-1 n=1 Tax=Pristionchus pacificus TaxID=54126 RepID=A0A2A6CG43_PRIPA|eukprot:PDM76991.1 osm-1 [Pristionchus pacificus]